MQKDENILKKALGKFSKYILYFIATAIILIMVVVICIQTLYLHEKKRFINTCMEDGHTLEYCENVWAEIDALN